MFPHLDFVTNPDVPLKDKVTYFANLNLFHGANLDEKQIKELGKKIFDLTESPISRCDGLLLLEAALQQETTFFYENWDKVVTASLKATNSTCQEIAFRILKLILRPTIPTNAFRIGLKISAVIEILSSSNSLNCLATLECLYLCMENYPSKIYDMKDKVESFVFRQMDTNSTQVCEVASKCIITLPRCASKDAIKSVSPKTNTSTFKNVLYTLQKIFNELLNIDEVDYINEEDNPETYPLPEMPDTTFSEIMMFARMFSSYSTCAAKFLCHENLVFEVPVLWILKFIDKVFEMTEYIKVCNSDDHREALKLVYPTILKGAITILETLVQNFGLIQQTENIISILSKAVEASYVATFIGVPNCQIRNLTWRILNVWLKKYGTQISVEAGNSNFLLQELFKDITPQELEAISPIVSKKQQMLSKIKKIEDSPEIDENSNINKTRSSTCIEALKVLHEFVNTASIFQEERFREDIANKIFVTCREIQKNMHPMKKFPFPYMNDKVRKRLYKIVIALGSSSDFNIRIMQQAFAVLKVAEKDKSCQIKLLNRRASSITRHILQPKKKFPEAVTNKIIYESPMEEDICSGWENITISNVYHSNQENHNVDSQIDTQIEIAENNASLSSEAQNSMQEAEMHNNFPSETEYSTSKFDRSINASHSDSENESIMEQEIADDENEESNTKSFVNVIHTNDIVKNEIPTEIDVSSEDENSSSGEEELEDSRVEEEEEEDEEDEEDEEEVNLNKVVVRSDQNGLASASEDEETAANFTKSENGEYSSEEGSCEEEEISREVCNDLKHEIETLEEDERPTKKQRLNEDYNETLEEKERLVKKLQLNNEESVDTLQEDNRLTKVAQLIENSVEVKENTESIKVNDVTKDVEDDLNSINEEVVKNSCHLAEESRTIKSPTFDEMCADLVLCESSQLAADS